MLTLTYEFKLVPTAQQIAQIDHDLEHHRRVWNYALRERKDWIQSRKCPINACSIRSEYIISADEPYPDYYKQAASLTQARKSIPALKAVNAQALQQTLKRLEQAFKRRKTHGAGFPRFKKYGRMRSFVFPQLGKHPLGNGWVKLPKLGQVKIRQSRPWPDGFIPKQARVLKRASGYYVLVSLQADVVLPEPVSVGPVVGVDVGLAYFLSTSDGAQVERPQFFVDLQRQLKLLQRRLKRKQKGSSNWLKAQAKVSKLHETIARTRKDFHFKQAHKLCDTADVIVVEDLNLVGLSRGFLGKHMLDAGHGQFLNQVLPWVASKRCKLVVKESAAGTSQECPDCGSITHKTIGHRWHECSCGCSMPRDIASGLVLKKRYLSRGAHGIENASGDGLTGLSFGLAS